MSEAAEGAARGTSGGSGASSYKDPRSIALVVTALLVIAAVVDAVAIALDVAELGLLQRIQGGEAYTVAEAERSDEAQIAMALAQLALVLVTGIAFITWTRRVYRNLPALGADRLRFRPGWAVGAWFVPFLNLVRPKQIVDDAWRASDYDLPRGSGAEWQGRPLPAYLHAWWGTLLASGFAGNAALRASESEDIAQLVNASRLTLLSDVLWLIAAVLAFVVVTRLTARQQRRAAKLGIGSDGLTAGVSNPTR